MRVLFVHQNFPGQYKHLAARLGADRAHRVVAIGEADNLAQRPEMPGVRRMQYRPGRETTKDIHPYLRNIEAAVLRGQAVARVALELRQQGFVPDLICAHPAWGEALYLRDIYPDSPMLGFFEFYYRGQGADLGYDPEFPENLDDRLRVRTWNMVQQSSFFSADWGVSPTRWQASVYPPEFQARLSVLHDGIDTRLLRPEPDAAFHLPDGRRLAREDEVITFVSRGLEPYRGFHHFMRALPELQSRRPRARVVVVGGDAPSYGRRPQDAAHWREKLLREVGGRLDLERLHFVGKIPYADFIQLLRVSSAHVYLTYPFVLSWSLLEAMAVGVPVAASDTQPVREFIRHEDNGLLFDFFDHAALTTSVCRLLEDQDLARALGDAGRRAIVEGYDLETICLPAHLRLMREMAGKRRAG